MTTKGFNAGVAIYELDSWREQASQLQADLHYWLRQAVTSHQGGHQLWQIATQPLLQVASQSSGTFCMTLIQLKR